MQITTLTPPFTTKVWSRNKISTTLNKSIERHSENTGTISITNINQRETSLLASTTKPRQFIYALKAGYGDDLKLISEGHIEEITWRHEGGDVTVDFGINEAHKYSENPHAIIGVPTISKGSSIYHFITSIRSKFNKSAQRLNRENSDNEKILNFEDYVFVGDREAIIKELRESKLESNITVEDFKKSLSEVLDSAGYSYYMENRKINIFKRPEESDTRFLRRKATDITNLNFETGLLNISLENITDYQFQAIKLSQIKFKSLFIPALIPFNIVDITEPKYPNLNSRYIIYNSKYSLNNKGEGGFYVECIARDLQFFDPTLSKTVGQQILGKKRIGSSQ